MRVLKYFKNEHWLDLKQFSNSYFHPQIDTILKCPNSDRFPEQRWLLPETKDTVYDRFEKVPFKMAGRNYRFYFIN